MTKIWHDRAIAAESDLSTARAELAAVKADFDKAAKVYEELSDGYLTRADAAERSRRVECRGLGGLAPYSD